MGRPLFSGRRHELDALDGVLDHVTAEGARVVLVEGPAGIGKTAVLHRFVERHPDLRVFWWSGEEARPNPSFAMIGCLFRSVGGYADLPDLPLGAAHRMCAHTLGNPRHLVALLAELPVESWSGEMVLPAPRLFSRSVVRTLSSCAEAARRLVEAVAVLGEHADLSTAAVIADVDEPLVALEEACRAGLLTTPHPTSAWHLTFPDPLVGAAVYGQLGAARRARLHLAAAGLDADDVAAPNHRTLSALRSVVDGELGFSSG